MKTLSCKEISDLSRYLERLSSGDTYAAFRIEDIRGLVRMAMSKEGGSSFWHDFFIGWLK